MTVQYSHRKNDPTGRFGGGWDWKVGFQANRNFRTVIINLLVASVRIERNRKAR